MCPVRVLWQSKASTEATTGAPTAPTAAAAGEAPASLTLAVPNLAQSGSFETKCQGNLRGSTKILRKLVRIWCWHYMAVGRCWECAKYSHTVWERFVHRHSRCQAVHCMSKNVFLEHVSASDTRPANLLK